MKINREKDEPSELHVSVREGHEDLLGLGRICLDFAKFLCNFSKN